MFGELQPEEIERLLAGQRVARLGVRSDLIVRMNSWLKYPVDRCLFDAGAPAWRKALQTLAPTNVGILIHK